ncbi:hypothetical protein [Nocardioides currus]|uniref:Uncharacterized protein n=1 Tax=Nocardioides currus TaxID=2133958 RepID=A0A2R7Z1J2_9ACTN|nr:hypothetical protein [Nocardioides currus]PUA82495.1 hypothetical protein C7S10_01755 [Nocardioides currus]
MNDELGPQPDPVIEEKEPNPGGADAIPDDAEDEGLARDLDPSANPVAQDVVPDAVTEPDADKTQAPEGEADDAESGAVADDEPEAGQEAEDGSVEPPA